MKLYVLYITECTSCPNFQPNGDGSGGGYCPVTRRRWESTPEFDEFPDDCTLDEMD